MAGKVSTRKRGKKYEYRFEGAPVGGKRQWITRGGFATAGEAYAAGMTAWQEYRDSGLKFTPSQLSVADFLDHWLQEYGSVNFKETTRSNYEKKIRTLIKPAIGKYPLASLQTSAVQALIDDLFNRGYSRNTISGVKGILSKSMKYARRMKLIQNSPVPDAELPRRGSQPMLKTRTKTRDVLDAATVRRIFERYPEGHPMHIPLVLGYRCGLRLGEAFALQWEDIDFGASTLSVNRQVQYSSTAAGASDPKRRRSTKTTLYFSPPKYDSYRTIQLDSATLALLRRTRQHQREMQLTYGPLFQRWYVTPERSSIDDAPPFVLNTDGIGTEVHMVNINDDGSLIRPRSMQECCRVLHGWHNVQKNGKVSRVRDPDPICTTFDFHSLRHTHCTELLLAGVTPKAVQLRLGHRDIKTTLNIYEHLTDKMAADTAAKLESMYRTS